MIDVGEYLARAAQRAGFKREYFVEKNYPTQPANVVAVPFYGDLRSTFIFSSFVLSNFKKNNPDKYIVMCSWPGFHGLFPYVDEYWSIQDESTTKSLATEANNFYNSTNLATEITRSLAEVLQVMTSRDLREYYDRGFTQKYWKSFGEIRRFLPEVPSANRLTHDFKTQMERVPGKKVIVYPSLRMRSRQQGKTIYLSVAKEFWEELIGRLLESGYCPVVYQNWFTYDMSRDFADRCIYLVARNVSDVLAAFRYVGCVLDIHSGISRLAIAARCPYVSVMERQIFVDDKDYEIDDLSCEGLPRQYIFSFSMMLMVGGPEDWKVTVFDNIMARLESFLPKIDRNKLPATSESYSSVSCENVRQRKAKRLGVAFINSSKQK